MHNLINTRIEQYEIKSRLGEGGISAIYQAYDLHLARHHKLGAGNIIMSAAYLASANGGIVTMEHLLHGTRRELQKMGRLVNEKDLAMEDGL